MYGWMAIWLFCNHIAIFFCNNLETVLKPKIDNHSLFFAAQKKRAVIKSISAKLFF